MQCVADYLERGCWWTWHTFYQVRNECVHCVKRTAGIHVEQVVGPRDDVELNGDAPCFAGLGNSLGLADWNLVVRTAVRQSSHSQTTHVPWTMKVGGRVALPEATAGAMANASGGMPVPSSSRFCSSASCSWY